MSCGDVGSGGRSYDRVRFEPHSYALGNTITLITSLIGFLLLIAAAFEVWKKNKPAAVKA